MKRNNDHDVDTAVNEINGPINVVRLEGNVGNINKVIYIMMDIHYEVNNQTQCNSVFSKDIKQFLVESFSGLNDASHSYDFFLEIMPTELQTQTHDESSLNYREKYITEVMKFFRQIFVYDSKKNKVAVPDIFRNVRFHYMDFRDYFEGNFFGKMNEIMRIAGKFASSLVININDLKYIISTVNSFRRHCELILSIMESQQSGKKTVKPKKIKVVSLDNNPPNAADADYEENLNYLLNKVFVRYNNKKVQEAVMMQIDDIKSYLTELANQCDDIVKRFKAIEKLLKETDGKLIKDENDPYIWSYGLSRATMRDLASLIQNKIENLFNYFILYFTRFMDIFFLRRFLDKEYITNAITYTGSYHSCIYISVLVKYFNFRITHVSHSKIADLTELEKEVKKREPLDLQELFYPNYRTQCADITNFPKNFI